MHRTKVASLRPLTRPAHWMEIYALLKASPLPESLQLLQPIAGSREWAGIGQSGGWVVKPTSPPLVTCYVGPAWEAPGQPPGLPRSSACWKRPTSDVLTAGTPEQPYGIVEGVPR